MAYKLFGKEVLLAGNEIFPARAYTSDAIADRNPVCTSGVYVQRQGGNNRWRKLIQCRFERMGFLIGSWLSEHALERLISSVKWVIIRNISWMSSVKWTYVPLIDFQAYAFLHPNFWTWHKMLRICGNFVLKNTFGKKILGKDVSDFFSWL